MRLPLLFAVLLVYSVVFEGPTAVSARCARHRRGCRSYGGVAGSCRIRRCVRHGCRARGRRCECRSYLTHRGFKCVHDKIFQGDNVSGGDGAPSFCQERCIRTSQGARRGCNRSLCFILPCSGNPGYFKCTAGEVPAIPGPTTTKPMTTTATTTTTTTSKKTTMKTTTPPPTTTTKTTTPTPTPTPTTKTTTTTTARVSTSQTEPIIRTTIVTNTTTLAPGVVTAEEWEQCTITRGGSRSGKNAQPQPDGRPINVDVTVIQEGVINLACKQSQVSVSCSIDGSITVSIDADQAAQLDLGEIYPIGAVFAYDRSVFTAPCVLNTFPLIASEDQAVAAQQQLRQRAAEVQDVFMKIGSVTGTPERAVIRGTLVSALHMFSSADIYSASPSRALSEASYEDSITMARANPAVRQLFPLNEDNFTARISVGSTTVSFNGKLKNEQNGIQEIELSVYSNGKFIETYYSVSREYDVQYTMAINNTGDSAIRRTAEPLALSTIRTGFPSINVTPTNNPPNCCNIPDLRFDEFFEIRPFLAVGSNAGGKIGAVGYNHRLVYPQQRLIISAVGPIGNPYISVSPDAVLPPTTADLTAASAVSINPTTSSTFDFDINVGMTPSMSLFLPSLVASLQQKASIRFNTRSGPETGVPAAEDAPIDNGACAAAHNLRINTVEELVDSQFVSLGSDGIQGNVSGMARLIPGMDSAGQDFVRNDCFFP